MKLIHPFGGHLRRRGRMALDVVLLLAVLYTVAHVMAPYLANEVTITVHSYSYGQEPRTGTVVYEKIVRDAATVRQVEVLVTSVRRYAPWTHVNCPVPVRTSLSYTFQFRLFGILVQEVRVPNDTCISWAVTTLGVREPFVSGGPMGEQWQELKRLTGVPLLPTDGD